ncbi:MAG: 3-deoxy-7-phosphoheptulonate synthase [Elusimicrobia bacterium RIFOXYB2_FULL_49_7]|nr:MAG: 3-deoxy-7-phosphoheptulonate synthase [Elusimicrobia bacterium RIFOXYB2_FULL_49_7]
MIRSTQDLFVREIEPLISPIRLKTLLPIIEPVRRLVVESRDTVKHILSGKDNRFLVIVGPCSIHDDASALEYAQRLNALRLELGDTLYIVMRVYFEKPRTTIGWKGLIADPDMNGRNDIEAGLKIARRLLLDITSLGIPAGTEMLDPIVPQYIADLITWAAIGARTTESQTHREMASGLSMPVGFKNNTDGNLQIAADAMESARHAHSFLGIDQHGVTSLVRTKGNPHSHIILRGGRHGPNYRPFYVRKAAETLHRAGLSPAIIVDCSHANSDKKYERQEKVLKSVIRQRVNGSTGLVGVMLESHLLAGHQPMAAKKADLRYGISVTDACMGWEATEKVLRDAARSLIRLNRIS